MDRFGNAITNLDAESPKTLGPCEIFLRGRRLCPVADFYQAVPRGHPVAVLGSTGFLEVAINGGSASHALNLRVGSSLLLKSVRSS